jgi:hypothetical protein
MLGPQIFGLVLFFWMALHTAQSLMDLADFLLVLTALWIALKNNDFRTLVTSFRPISLWPIWLLTIILGYIFGAPVTLPLAWKGVQEFRWILSFLCYVYLFKKIDWQTSHLRGLTLALLGYSILDFILFFVNYGLDPRAGGLFHHSMPFAHTMGPSILFLFFLEFKKRSQRTNPKTHHRIEHGSGNVFIW